MTTASAVLLFYPNLIGYLRVLCMVLSFYFANDWVKSVTFYGLAFFGDVVDGYIARMFEQSSEFGGILDMVTDRVSTAGLLTILSNREMYRDHQLIFVMLIVLDIASHWFHVMSVSAHHKSKEALENRNALLKWYYSIYPLFGYCCVGTEVLYLLLYVRSFEFHDAQWMTLAVYSCLPACVIKQIINIAQLASAAYTIAERDASKRSEKRR